MIKQLKTKLKQLQETVEYPNAGGCAIIAYAIVEYAKRIDPTVNAEVVYLFTRDDDSYYRNVSNNKPDSCAHAVASINGRYYDATGRRTTGDLILQYKRFIRIPVNQTFVLRSINKRRWNPTFDRHSEVPKILKIMELQDHSPKIARFW